MPRRKRCIGCGREAPPHPTHHGWHVIQASAPGKGQRWYRSCGCQPAAAFGANVEELFAAGKDCPDHFPAKRMPAPLYICDHVHDSACPHPRTCCPHNSPHTSKANCYLNAPGNCMDANGNSFLVQCVPVQEALNA